MKKTGNEKIRIVLAEDQQLVRKALISLISENPNVQVIGEAENGRQLLDLIKKEEPDIVLLDLEMPVMNGQETLSIMNKRFPKVKVIILSMHAEMELMAELMTMGAKAYLPKECRIETMFEAIQTVHKEGHYFDKTVSHAMMNGLLKEKMINPVFGELSLSEREVEVLKELCGGKTNKEIARDLKITASTVDFHRGNIYRKTKSHNIAELVKYSIRNGFVNLK